MTTTEVKMNTVQMKNYYEPIVNDDESESECDSDSEEYDSENDEPLYTPEELEKLNSQFPQEILIKLFNNLPKI